MTALLATPAIKLEIIDCVIVGTERRFETLCADGCVIAEREIGSIVWLDVFGEDELPDCPRCGRPWGLRQCCSRDSLT